MSIHTGTQPTGGLSDSDVSLLTRVKDAFLGSGLEVARVELDQDRGRLEED